MAIRKDLDDMLNSLKTGGGEVSSKPAAKTTEKHAKSIYDEMSVDDLLHALTEDKKPSLAEDILGDLAVTEEAPETNEPEEPVVPDEPAVTVPEAAAPAKKKVVITSELPDYEKLRREEMEREKLSFQRPEAHLSYVNRHADGIQEFAPPQPEPIKVRMPEPVKEEEPAEKALPEEITDEFSAEEVMKAAAAPEEPEEDEGPSQEELLEESAEKRRKGFFSRFRKHDRDDESETVQDEAPAAESAEEEPADSIGEVDIDDLFNAPEQPEEKAPGEDELPEETEEPVSEDVPEEEPEPLPEEEPIYVPEEATADELLDAALAAINEAAAESLTEEQPEETEEPSPEEETAPEEISGETEEVSEPESEDRVSSLIDGIREDAANAIAELESPRETEDEPEKEPEAPEAAPEEKEQEEVSEKKVKAGKISAALGNILSEDPDELIAERSEHTEEDGTVVTSEKGRFKKRFYAVLGVIFAVFAVIGIITVAGKGIKMFRSFTSGEVKKDGFTEVIYPAVIMDIDTFDSPSELSSEQLITAAIWSIIMDEDKVSKYPLNAGGDTISISAYDVEAQAVELFGTDHQPFEHTTVGRVEPRFFYDTETGAYNVKVKPIIFTYEPEIKSIVKSGSNYTVQVDYIDELPAWMDKSVAKSVEYSLTENENGTYRINSMHINYINNSNS